MCKAEIFTLPRIGNIHVALTNLAILDIFFSFDLQFPSKIDGKVQSKTPTRPAKLKTKFFLFLYDMKERMMKRQIILTTGLFILLGLYIFPGKATILESCAHTNSDSGTFDTSPTELLNEIIKKLEALKVPDEAPMGISNKIRAIIKKVEKAKIFYLAGKEQEAKEILQETCDQLLDIISQIDNLRCSKKITNCIPDLKAEETNNNIRQIYDMIVNVFKKNQNPQAILQISSGQGRVPFTAVFDISTSFDPDGLIVSYTLDFGDGTPFSSGPFPGGPFSHVYSQPGIFEAILMVVDDRGATGEARQRIEALAPSDWPMFHQNPHHTGIAEEDLGSPNSLEWSAMIPTYMGYASPAIAEGRVFFGAENVF